MLKFFFTISLSSLLFAQNFIDFASQNNALKQEQNTSKENTPLKELKFNPLKMQDSIKLAQLSDGYRYNSDSLLLADFVLEMGIKNQVLEVGSGCGIIGILLKICF